MFSILRADQLLDLLVIRICIDDARELCLDALCIFDQHRLCWCYTAVSDIYTTPLPDG